MTSVSCLPSLLIRPRVTSGGGTGAEVGVGAFDGDTGVSGTSLSI